MSTATSVGSSDLPPPEFQTLKLPAHHELRFHLPFNVVVTVKCISGLAELAGRELPDKRAIDLPPGTRASIFSFMGCTLEVSQPRQVPGHHASGIAAASDSNPLPVVSEPVPNTHAVMVANMHVALEQARKTAAVSGLPGPRVMIVGEPDTGKSTVAKTLANYIHKLDKQPLLVDLNPENPTISIPGTLSLIHLTHPLDPSLGLCASHPSLLAAGLGALPLILWHGSDQPVREFDKPAWHLYERVCKEAARACDDKVAHDEHVREAGVVVDAPGGIGQDKINWLVDVFKINYLIYLSATLPTLPTLPSTTQLIHLSPVPGVQPKDRQFRKYLHLHSIREYFYGPLGASIPSPTAGAVIGRAPLTPHNIAVPTSIISVVKVTPVPGTEVDEASGEVVQVEKIDAAPNTLVHSILAVMNASGSGDVEFANVDQVVGANVMGFVYVSDYTEQRGKVELLIPFPGRLPKTKLVAGAVKWMELA
ncbi:hypothetical protein BCR44DRAFT_155317 [Catenaria anguillulae PL171]|uniref:Polynucleotide 5'-hydroxyl-kinase GRC3 n=1 Tax=Catenaria anguillulae PL171 TaxID=765915 RepID=A0A1Y2HI36_9FUNG|nr:hypothetical protein BCR44DRAFT_155317 [Catenaria anguillulae PL171]